MYCESQPRYPGKSWRELFPDDVFPNDSPEDRAKSKYTLLLLDVLCPVIANSCSVVACCVHCGSSLHRSTLNTIICVCAGVHPDVNKVQMQIGCFKSKSIHSNKIEYM